MNLNENQQCCTSLINGNTNYVLKIFILQLGSQIAKLNSSYFVVGIHQSNTRFDFRLG